MREMGAANMAGIKKKLDALLTHEHSEIIALASVCSLIVGIVVVKLALGASYAEIWSWVQPTGIIGFLATIAFVFIGQLRQMRQQFRKSEEAEKTARTELTLRTLAMFKSDLEDLSKQIAEVAGHLATKSLESYERKFASGSRHAYMQLLLQGDGERLRKIYNAADTHERRLRLGELEKQELKACAAEFRYAEKRRDRLRRRFQSYLELYDKICTPSKDTPLHEVIQSSALGKVACIFRDILEKEQAQSGNRVSSEAKSASAA